MINRVIPRPNSLIGARRDYLTHASREAMDHVTVFLILEPGAQPVARYGFRQLGRFFGLRGESLAERWKFPKVYDGVTIKIIGTITKEEWATGIEIDGETIITKKEPEGETSDSGKKSGGNK